MEYKPFLARMIYLGFITIWEWFISFNLRMMYFIWFENDLFQYDLEWFYLRMNEFIWEWIILFGNELFYLENYQSDYLDNYLDIYRTIYHTIWILFRLSIRKFTTLSEHFFFWTTFDIYYHLEQITTTSSDITTRLFSTCILGISHIQCYKCGGVMSCVRTIGSRMWPLNFCCFSTLSS